jgi:hypothetical protein
MLVSWSLKSYKTGEIPTDGTMGVVLADIGPLYKDSVSMKEADPNTTDAFAEQYSAAISSFSEDGEVTIEGSLLNAEPLSIQTVKGGTIAADGAWEKPVTSPIIEKCHQMITKSDLLIEIPRGQILATLNGDLKASSPFLIPFKVKVLQPNGPGVPSVRIVKYLAPTVNAGNATSVTVATGTTPLAGTAVPFRGTITKMLWTVDSKPVGANPVLATPAALACVVSGLSVVGTYKFKLAASDSNDYTGTSSVTITVTA